MDCFVRYVHYQSSRLCLFVEIDKDAVEKRQEAQHRLAFDEAAKSLARDELINTPGIGSGVWTFDSVVIP